MPSATSNLCGGDRLDLHVHIIGQLRSLNARPRRLWVGEKLVRLELGTVE